MTSSRAELTAHELGKEIHSVSRVASSRLSVSHLPFFLSFFFFLIKGENPVPKERKRKEKIRSGGERKLDYKRAAQSDFQGLRTVLCPDSGDGYGTPCIYQNSQNAVPKKGHLLFIK